MAGSSSPVLQNRGTQCFQTGTAEDQSRKTGTLDSLQRISNETKAKATGGASGVRLQGVGGLEGGFVLGFGGECGVHRKRSDLEASKALNVSVASTKCDLLKKRYNEICSH